jgi:hypothetical protein
VLVLIAVLLALIPALAILYPFLRSRTDDIVFEDEASTYSALSMRWEAAVAGIKNTELERAIGNLAEDDHRQLREQYMTEAALVMKAMELEDQQEQELMAGLELEVSQVRRRVLGGDGPGESPGGNSN